MDDERHGNGARTDASLDSLDVDGRGIDGQGTGGQGLDGLWERMRSEERAEQLSQVVQDAVRDARVADAIAGADGQLCRQG